MPQLFPAAALVRFLTNSLGLYLHIPFCNKRCAYCSFYSAVFTDCLCDKYTDALMCEIKVWGGRIDRPIDTLYIGGGTPSLLGARLGAVLDTVRQSFCLLDGAEVTLEVNPQSADDGFLNTARAAGVNRLSIGVQSGSDGMLSLLGRTHTASDAHSTVLAARRAGFDNISVDLMIGLPESNRETLKADIDFICSLSPDHISAYILKVEPKTLLAAGNYALPDDDQAAEQYLYMCESLAQHEFLQYEVSNFARAGRQSRHNLKYWCCQEYIGIGPSAHSFFEGRRFYYPDDLKGFIARPQTALDGIGGDCEERLMLALRLSRGVDLADFTDKISPELDRFTESLKNADLIKKDGTHISLTPRGMVVSNSIITEITERLYENL